MNDGIERAGGAHDESDLRPGPLAWLVIGLGWLVLGVATLGVLRDERLGGSWSWATWVLGAALVHDLVVLPVVLGLGWTLTRLVPATWRTPLRSALIVAGIVTLSVWPIARRWGARADNPSILPLPVARNLAILVTVLVVVAIGVGAWSTWRTRASHRPVEKEPS